VTVVRADVLRFQIGQDGRTRVTISRGGDGVVEIR
jgi:hypothetical protein